MNGKKKLMKMVNQMKKKKPIKEEKNKIYISYNMRLFLVVILFVLSFGCCLYLALHSFQYKHPETISYQEQKDVNYKVYLKPNDFYEQEYLDENMMYVANLIDHISIDFLYNFNIEKPIFLDFDYQIIGEITIYNPSTNVNYFQKDYTLMEPKKVSLKEQDAFSIKENVVIDYDYYNQLANTFKSNYGVHSESNLKVYLQIHKDGAKYNIDLTDTQNSEVTIPLSLSAVQIKFDVAGGHQDNEIVIQKAWVFQPFIFILEVILFIIAAFCLSRIINYVFLVFRPKSSYDRMLSNILKNYDRLISETKTGISFEKYHIIEIEKFEELLDIRDNLKLPIMYYNIVNHQKCYFYIKHNDDVYLMILKAVDLEQKKKN